MNNKETCPHCGAKMVEYKHSLSKGLLRCLVNIIKKADGKTNVQVRLKDLNMPYNMTSNMQKLKYWRLIEKIGDETGKGGKWKLTEKGKLFACGAIKLPRYVYTYRGAVMRYEGESIGIEEVTGGWRYRPDYARDAITIQT